MRQYPKTVLTVEQQIQAYKDAGMVIPSEKAAKEALLTIGYYRLRGYCYHQYDNEKKRYAEGSSFQNIIALYRFDKKLSMLLFDMLSTIEVSLRARLAEALLIHKDPLILNDPSIFENKQKYWQNMGSIALEIARSHDVFIKHNYDRYAGQIPVWASVEIMSFGTLSKTIKNLKAGAGTAYPKLAEHYAYRTPNGNVTKPSIRMLASWIHAASVLRNMCAHNSRIYNRVINVRPELLAIDKAESLPRYYGLYQALLAMKYLRPTDEVWVEFVARLKTLLMAYDTVIEMSRMNFPSDWEAHLSL